MSKTLALCLERIPFDPETKAHKYKKTIYLVDVF